MVIIPDYIETRIRQPIPTDRVIVPNTTPVVAFGDVRTAKVATLGLNPSRSEFLHTNGRELIGTDRRLETLTSLDVSSLAHAPLETVARVFHACNDYFHRKPYWAWFRQLEAILAPISASYKNGTAYHLDLVQWATDPVWGRIPSATIREQLLQADAAFLRQQLTSEQIQVLLLNGRSVIDAFSRMYGSTLHWQPEQVTHRSAKTHLMMTHGPHDITVIGWTINIQSSFGVSNEFRALLAQQIAKLLCS